MLTIFCKVLIVGQRPATPNYNSQCHIEPACVMGIQYSTCYTLGNSEIFLPDLADKIVQLSLPAHSDTTSRIAVGYASRPKSSLQQCQIWRKGVAIMHDWPADLANGFCFLHCKNDPYNALVVLHLLIRALLL